MSLTVEPRTFAPRDPDLRGARLLVVGLGRSGLAAARLACARGARVTLADRRAAAELGPAADEAQRIGAAVVAGGHPPELAAAADLVVLSPGVPETLPLVARAHELGLPVWGEVELSARFCRGRIAGITGSNGKSTTTSMTGTILRRSGVPGGTGGNLGTPLADLLEHDGPAAWHALELSSFQLQGTATLRAQVAAVLNLSSNHLDRHPTMDAYLEAKARLLRLQQPEDHAVLNADDPYAARFVGAARGQVWWFSTRREVERGGFVRDGRMILREDAAELALLDAAELPVPGAHNVANALAAAVICRRAGCSVDAIRDGLRAYRALPHRLELVGRIGAVTFYNDSKATSPASTACALEAFSGRAVHLILGGRDKGADWTALLPRIRERARRVLLVGEAAPMLASLLADVADVELCHTVARAASRGLDRAAPGEIVLLAPGCASFDQYRDFEERGEDFRRAVRALGAGEPGRG